MASFFSHPAFPVGLVLTKIIAPSRRLFWLSVILTLLPDADVIAFKFGVPYESQWGHRGFTHSIVFSLVLALAFSFLARVLQSSKKAVFVWSFTSLLSHTVMDALTNGGLGVAVFWPFDHGRYFFPWTPVEVSPIGVSRFLSMRGVEVVINEILWLWLPCLASGVLLRKFVGKICP